MYKYKVGSSLIKTVLCAKGRAFKKESLEKSKLHGLLMSKNRWMYYITK